MDAPHRAVPRCHRCGNPDGVIKGYCTSCRNARSLEDLKHQQETEQAEQAAQEWRQRIGGPYPKYTWGGAEGAYWYKIEWHGKVLHSGTASRHRVMLSAADRNLERVIIDILAGLIKKPVAKAEVKK